MRQVKRWRYNCDFCKKSGGSAGHMKKHEAGCTLNPGRVCGMCEINEPGSEQRPIQELVAILEAHGGGPPTHDQFGEPPPAIPLPEALRDATNGCPACILAALRQSGGPWVFEFDYTKERESMWAQIREDERERSDQESYFDSTYGSSYE